MTYIVRWQLIGRSGRPLDKGTIEERFYDYSDAVAAAIELLRPYEVIDSYFAESYWLIRRSQDADLSVWLWIEHYDFREVSSTLCAPLSAEYAASEAA
jgi:hypothetical protein